MQLNQSGQPGGLQAMPSEFDGNSIVDFLELMEELREVLVEENDFLSRGLPAGLSELCETKIRLVREYERATKTLVERFSKEIVDNPAIYRQIVATGTELRTLAVENMTRVTAAKEATRSRIEAVMAAIKNHDGGNRPYGRNGKQAGTSPVSLMNFQDVSQGRPGARYKV